jgi:hypothetical protein
VLARIEKQKFKTLVSNDYDEVAREICLYLKPEKPNPTARGKRVKNIPMEVVRIAIRPNKKISDL